jgi:hypothetical protein
MAFSPEKKCYELENLCLDLGTDSLFAENSARLEQLLLGNPELQDAYCRWVAVDHLLYAEFGERGHVFSSLLGPDVPNSSNSCSSNNSSALNTEKLNSLHTTRAFHKPSFGNTGSSRKRRWAYATVAASVAALLAVVASQTFQFWKTQAPPDVSLSVDHESQELVTDDAETPKARAGCIVLKGHETIAMLHRVTNTSWQGSRQQLSTPLDEELSERLFQGAAQLSPFNGQAAGGFVAVLPPGSSLELNVFADSLGENALAVMELDELGRPTGQLASFSNQGGTQAKENLRRYGQLGSWSDRNSTEKNKYYLLAGMQKLSQSLGEPHWYVADFLVMVDRPDLLHIGWDDTGWTENSTSPPDTSPPETSSAGRDKDFNDIAVTIRIRRPDAPEPGGNLGVVTHPAVLPKAPLKDGKDVIDPGAKEAGYALTIGPGQGVILAVSSKATDPNSFTVVDSTTGQIWWSGTNESAHNRYLGSFVIENYKSEPLSLLIVSHHRPPLADSHGDWQPSKLRVLVDEARCQTIGFEDSKGDRDWDDMRVNLHWFSNWPLSIRI